MARRVLLMTLAAALLALMQQTFFVTAGEVGRFRKNSPLFQDSFHVRSLDASSFDEMLNNSREVWVVDFYSPWCPHCRHFAPAWEKVAEFYAESMTVHVGAVDCTQFDAICTREKIYGYPGVKLFHVPANANASVRYTGGKSMKEIVLWLEASLIEENMQSGVDPDSILTNIELVLNDRVKDPADSNPHGKPKDQALSMKYTRLRDAGAAAAFTLERGLFMGMDVLEGERYDAAMLWIGALAASFPLEVNRAAFTNLHDAARGQSRWDKAAWVALLEQWKSISHRTTFPRNLLASTDEAGWANCGTYTCGLWTLFHAMSVGTDAPLSDGSLLPTRKPSEVAAAIRLFVTHFFGCENCVKHFLAANPPSAMAEIAAYDSEGPQTLIIWLWRMHNKVNKATKKGLWPSVVECPLCYGDDAQEPSIDPATLNNAGIEAYVRSVYAHKESDVFAMDYQSNGLVAALLASLEGFGSLLAIAAFVGVSYFVLKSHGARLMDFHSKFGRSHTA